MPTPTRRMVFVSPVGKEATTQQYTESAKVAFSPLSNCLIFLLACAKHGNCATCRLTSPSPPPETECLSCKLGSYMGGGYCSECRYVDGCANCDGNVFHCNSCKPGYYMKDQDNCIACASGCNTCTSSSCTGCNANYYFDVSNTCVQCPEKTYSAAGNSLTACLGKIFPLTNN